VPRELRHCPETNIIVPISDVSRMYFFLEKRNVKTRIGDLETWYLMSVVSELVFDVSGIGAGVGCQWYRSWCWMSVV